jgi:hypothetical protein
MKLFAADGSLAFLSVGESSVGVFAAGQFARGFFAFGQFAYGVVAVGQFSGSVVGIGQFGGGVSWFAGMFGLGGRGFCLRLIPGIDPPRVAPAEVAFRSLAASGDNGFVKAAVVGTPKGARLAQGGAPLAVKMTLAVAAALEASNGRLIEVYAHLKVVGQTVVCDRLIEVPGTRSTYPRWFQALRVAALVGLGTLWWYGFTYSS